MDNPPADRRSDEVYLQVVWERVSARAPLSETLDLVAERMASAVGFTFSAVILPKGGQWDKPELAGSYSFPQEYAQHLTGLYANERAETFSPTQRAARSGRMVVIRDIRSDDDFAPWREYGKRFGYASLVSAPLIIGQSVIGILNGYCSVPREYTSSELQTVRRMASQTAIAVEMATLIERQVRAIDDLTSINTELERERRREELARMIHDQLTHAAVAGAGIPQIIRVLADVTGRDASFVAKDETVTAVVSGDDAQLTALSRSLFDESTRAGDRRERDKSELRADLGVMTAPVVVDGERIGLVVGALPSEGHEDLDRRAVEHAASILALESARQRIARATEERLNADFLMDLVNGRGGGLERMESRAQYHGISPKVPYRIMVVELDGWDALLRRERPSTRVADQLLQRLLSAISTTAKLRIAGCLVSHVEDRVTIAAPAGEEGGYEAFESVFADMLYAVMRITPQVGLQSGLGAVAERLDGFAASHRGAFEALTVLQRIGRPNQILASEQLGVIGLLLTSSQPDDLRRLSRQILDPIARKDSESGGALLETLFCMLDCNLHLARTASRMFVHINTVKYRMRRLQELFDIDVNDPQQLVELTIAQMIHRLENPMVTRRLE
ncbi:helix-turn-helix domain-containing protein [Microbacterium sp. BR1]|uniref:helix-turn-helix domain-containing protein n=1 Tax=Microbacterium sp. BR1 TaxID=1070896 RepID=UPI000C2B6953|nr:helix-turn-helix domain-containing protein [Microbacterium sp. BR1]